MSLSRSTRLPLVLFLAASLPAAASAQGLGSPTVSSSKVGYIDSALPLSHLRLRYDAGFENNRPSRAEYFYARSGPFGPGFPKPESSVNHQDISVHWEEEVRCGLSVFVQGAARFINPEINDNSAGLADMDVGFKWAFVNTGDTVGTFVLRGYLPTGDASRGLGTHHCSIEPGILFYQQVSECIALEGELKYWIPINGTDFAGNIIRYGLGVSYNLWRDEQRSLSPVVEVVGWQVLDGLEGVFVEPGAGLPRVQDAAGDAIVNLKIGVRIGLGERADLYAGYGRSLTGDRWYRDIYRVELRLFR